MSAFFEEGDDLFTVYNNLKRGGGLSGMEAKGRTTAGIPKYWNILITHIYIYIYIYIQYCILCNN